MNWEQEIYSEKFQKYLDDELAAEGSEDHLAADYADRYYDLV